MTDIFIAFYDSLRYKRITGIYATYDDAAERLWELVDEDFKDIYGHRPNVEELEEFMLDRRIYTVVAPLGQPVWFNTERGVWPEEWVCREVYTP